MKGCRSTTMLEESESEDGWQIEAWTKNGYEFRADNRTHRSDQHKVPRIFDQLRFVAPRVRALRNSPDREDKSIRPIVHLARHIRTRLSRLNRPHEARAVDENSFFQRVGEHCERRENDRFHAVNRLRIHSDREEAVVRSRRCVVHRNQNRLVPRDRKERLRLQRNQQAARPRRRLRRGTQR